ncbi:hypothetical protein NDU88_004325 [Pleurodeles waltl]|uniref:Uncharacterized protein n=1 Tax=Pleurodeles waltl TaxID=8319 RepID=A0AAV7RHW3_PLEWA|nr:hypothetical protein NDU88_004325 [Pleurodeles waltl]
MRQLTSLDWLSRGAERGGNVSSAPLILAAGRFDCPVSTVSAKPLHSSSGLEVGSWAGPQSAGKDIRREALIMILDEPDNHHGNQQSLGSIILSHTGSVRCSGQDAGPSRVDTGRSAQAVFTGASDPRQVHVQPRPLVTSVAAYVMRCKKGPLLRNDHTHALVTCGALDQRTSSSHIQVDPGNLLDH